MEESDEDSDSPELLSFSTAFSFSRCRISKFSRIMFVISSLVSFSFGFDSSSGSSLLELASSVVPESEFSFSGTVKVVVVGLVQGEGARLQLAGDKESLTPGNGGREKCSWKDRIGLMGLGSGDRILGSSFSFVVR